MPPLALPVSVKESPFVIEVALIVELLVSSDEAAATVTVNVLLAIVPSASLTLIRTVYVPALEGVQVLVAVVL